MSVNIHGKEYKTVAERLQEIGDKLKGVSTEVLYLEPQIMVKATITTDKGTFTGISAADPSKSIEAKTPVEVAETSAVGRALAFAGYAGSEIASADEMQKALTSSPKPATATKEVSNDDEVKCPKCSGKMWDNRPKKATGEYSVAAPDFKCRDKACDGKIWPDKNKPIMVDGSDYMESLLN
jgi:hypothetical protein